MGPRDIAAMLASGAAMGLIISALGAGGSLFVVPVLLCGLRQPLSTATGTSLAVVLIAAAVASTGHFRAKRIDLRVAAWFAPPAALGAWLGAWLHERASERLRVELFAIAMIAAAIRMLIPQVS